MSKQGIAVGSRVKAIKNLPFGITPPPDIPNIAIPEGTQGIVKQASPVGENKFWIHAEWENGRIHNADPDEYEVI